MNQLMAAICIIALSGCATIFGDDNDQITIHSNDPDAALLVNGNQVGYGRATYTLSRDKSAILTASKPGCNDAVMPTGRTIVGATFLNILFPIGFLVDLATGKIERADPTDYNLTPHCVAAAYPMPVQSGYAPQPVYAAPVYAPPPAQPQAYTAPQPQPAPSAANPYAAYPLAAPQPMPVQSH